MERYHSDTRAFITPPVVAAVSVSNVLSYIMQGESVKGRSRYSPSGGFKKRKGKSRRDMMRSWFFFFSSSGGPAELKKQQGGCTC